MLTKYLVCFLSITLIAESVIARDLFVSNRGNDQNSGSISSPYATIAKASSVAKAGDTVFIRQGEYREVLKPKRSGKNGAPIIFQAYKNEKVVISAMERISGWELDAKSVYKTQIDWDLGQENMVIHDGQTLDLARWPNNTDGDPYTKDALRNSGGSAKDVIADAFLDYSHGLPLVDWSNGGSVYFYGDKPGSGWITWKAFIKSSSDSRITFDLNTGISWIREYHSPDGLGDFYLEGIREALDYENEWYFDSGNRTLYIQLPEGEKPKDQEVHVRKRVLAIDLHNKKHIHIKNIAVFGGSINVTGRAKYNLLDGISSFYGNYTRGVFKHYLSGQQSVLLEGKYNRLRNSEIAYGSGSGVFDKGIGNKIINNYIHDFNTLGSYDALLNLRGGKNSIVKYNTISRGGRDAIQAFNKYSEIAYNDVSFSNLVADDCALFYTVGGPHFIELHHNWFHDAYSSGSKKKAAGIYLDNSAEAIKVHHNVVWNTEWTSVQINWNGKDLDIFNNTFLKGSEVMGAWHKEGTEFVNVRVWNNLSDDDSWEPQSDKQNNLTFSESPLMNMSENDFRLKPGYEAINRGKKIEGITDGFSGPAPDIGAYEDGQTYWRPGITWNINKGVNGRGCYGLPGEACSQ